MPLPGSTEWSGLATNRTDLCCALGPVGLGEAAKRRCASVHQAVSAAGGAELFGGKNIKEEVDMRAGQGRGKTAGAEFDQVAPLGIQRDIADLRQQPGRRLGSIDQEQGAEIAGEVTAAALQPAGLLRVGWIFHRPPGFIGRNALDQRDGAGVELGLQRVLRAWTLQAGFSQNWNGCMHIRQKEAVARILQHVVPGICHQDAHLGGGGRPVRDAVFCERARTAVKDPRTAAGDARLLRGHRVEKEMHMFARQGFAVCQKSRNPPYRNRSRWR